MSADLLNLYARHRGYCSDKWEANLRRYVPLLEPFRNHPIRFLEVGVQNGGSLEIWARLFPAATILVGCDIDPRCAALEFADPRLHLVIGDVLDPNTLSQITAASREFDVIIDDGSHRQADIVGAFCALFPTLADGGLYVIEDLHCSYWQEFHGGLFAPHSAMSFLKSLCDIVNHQHWGIPDAPGFVLSPSFPEHAARISADQLARIHSVEFSNSLCVIRKENPAHNVLGRRIVAGELSPVFPRAGLSAGDSSTPGQAFNRWSKPPGPPAEADVGHGENSPGFQGRAEEVAALQARIDEMQKGIAGLQAELATIKRLWSWRLMAPFRNLWRLPGRVRRQWRRRFPR